MSTIELKKLLIDWIRQTDDSVLLKDIYRLFETGTEEGERIDLTEGLRKAIEEARGQIRGDKFLSEDKANKEIDEWLNK